MWGNNGRYPVYDPRSAYPKSGFLVPPGASERMLINTNPHINAAPHFVPPRPAIVQIDSRLCGPPFNNRPLQQASFLHSLAEVPQPPQFHFHANTMCHPLHSVHDVRKLPPVPRHEMIPAYGHAGSKPHSSCDPPQFYHPGSVDYGYGTNNLPPNSNFQTNAVPQAASCQVHQNYAKVAPCPKKVVNVDDLLTSEVRPPRLVIILRGLPGSGKTFTAKAIKEKELSITGMVPRILSIDDYFLVDKEDGAKDLESVYEYNPALEKSFRESLLKTFRKTINDGLFPFIIVDSCNEKISYFDEYVAHALSRGFVVYCATIPADVETCKLRSHGRRPEKDVEMMATIWEPTPDRFLHLQVSSLVHPDINTVEMEDAIEEQTEQNFSENGNRKRKAWEGDEKELDDTSTHKKSKWEMIEAEANEVAIDRLDGLSRAKSDKEKQSNAKHANLSANKDDLFTQSGAVILENLASNTLEKASSRKSVKWADIDLYKKTLNNGQNQFDRMLSEINARAALVQVHLI